MKTHEIFATCLILSTGVLIMPFKFRPPYCKDGYILYLEDKIPQQTPDMILVL